MTKTMAIIDLLVLLALIWVNWCEIYRIQELEDKMRMIERKLWLIKYRQFMEERKNYWERKENE